MVLSLKTSKNIYHRVNNLMAKKKYQRNWLERKLDEYNHTMELIRTILPFLILLLQIYILTKLI